MTGLLARWAENLRMAVAMLTARKLRSLLTLLGVVIGVTSVIAVAAIVDGLNRTVQDRVEQLGSRTFYVTRVPIGTTPSRMPARYRKRRLFEYDYGDLVRELCPSLDAVSIGATRTSAVGDSNEVRYGAQLVERVVIRGVEPGYADAIPMFAVGEGRFLNQNDVDKTRYVAVLGAGIAQTLFPSVDPLGKVVRINRQFYEVIGVLPADSGLLGAISADQNAVIPTSTFRKEYPEIRELVLSVSVRRDVPRQQGLDELTEGLRRIRRMRGKAANDFDITSSDFLTALWNQLTGALVMLATVISSIGLLVGGIGVMNIMLISVTERTAEIGVRKAIGARKSDIRMQFLLEAILLTVCGGLIGVLLGAAIAYAVRMLYPSVQATLSYQWAALGVLVSAGVGLVFGFFPANRAANLDPIVCLRYE